jgi:hypothetical protein
MVFSKQPLTIFQFHLIARIDDTTQVLLKKSGKIWVDDSFCTPLIPG